jgi:uncharacterized metal-binding protein
MYQCAYCGKKGCKSYDDEATMSVCAGKNDAVHAEAARLFMEEENQKIAKAAGQVEVQGYGRSTRMEEVMHFCRLCGYEKIGLVFCSGLSREAQTVTEILTHNGFTVDSALCKAGSLPKSLVGLEAEDTHSHCADEVMCNPIGQALLMNELKVDFTLIVGLCVGHDTLVMKYLESPMSVLAVKDRVTGHNPLAAIYTARSYYRSRFFPED